MAGKPRKSAGTYSFTDLLRLTMRHPCLLLAALLTDGTTDQENAVDSTAVQDGETRRVLDTDGDRQETDLVVPAADAPLVTGYLNGWPGHSS
jgi:hypothetical protein